MKLVFALLLTITMVGCSKEEEKELLEVIKELANEGMTMIIVTHEMNFAKNVSSKVILMDNGVIVEENNPHEFFTNPQHERTIQFLKSISNK